MSQRQRRAKQGKSNGRKLSSAIIIASIVFLVGGLVWYYFYAQRERSAMVTPQVSLPAPVMVISEEDFLDEKFESCFPEAVEALRLLAPNPDLGASAKKTLESVSEIESLLEPLFEDQPGHLTLDVILQFHRAKLLTKREFDIIVPSQKRVYSLLQAGKYEVVGLEGWNPTSKITYDDLRKQYEQDLQKAERSSKTRSSTFAELLEVDGGIKYAIDNPSATVIGYEHQLLARLYGSIIDLYTSAEFKNVASAKRRLMNRFDEVDRTLKNLRDEVAVAHMIRELKQRGGNRGAIVIGEGHKDNLVRILRQLHIKSNVYDTSKG